MSSKANKVLVFSFSQVVSLLINFFVSPYLSRALPKPDYAAFNQVIILISLTSVLFSLGLQAVVYYFFSQRGEYQHRIVSSLQFLILLVAALSFICLLTGSFLPPSLFNTPEILYYLRFCSLAVGITFLNNYLISILVFNDRTKIVAAVVVLTSIISVTFIYISLNIWNSIRYALVFSQVIAPLTGLLINSWFARKYISWSITPDKSSCKKILKVSLPLYVTSLLGSSYLYISSFFVIFILGNVEYANYRNGAVEIPFISTIAFSVSAVLLPDLNKYFQQNKQAALDLKIKIINQCIFLLYPVIVFFIVYHREFIVSYFSEKYAESAIVFAIYSCTCFVRINDYQDVLITAGKSSYILRANIYYFLINITMVVVLGLLFGITGVAVAASLSVFALAFILLRKDADIFGISIKDFFQVHQIALLLTISFAVSLVLKYLLEYFFRLDYVTTFIIAAAFYFPVVYIFLFRKGFIIPAVTQMLRRKIPGASYILPKQ